MRDVAPKNTLPMAARWLLAGTFASNIGNGMHTLAAGAFLYHQTGSIAAFGAVVVIEQCVTLLMQVVAGPMVDTGDPRRTAILAETLRGVAIGILSLLLILFPGNALTIVVAMTIVIRCAHSFYRAGTFALTPTLVRPGDLTQFNSWFSACQQGGQLFGLGMTGLVVAEWGTPAAFFINGASFLVSAATLGVVRNCVTEPSVLTVSRSRPMWRSVFSGWGEFAGLLRHDVKLLGLIVVSTADNVALILFNLILAPLVAERFSASPTSFSLLAAGFAFGAMAASAIAGPIAYRIGVHRAVHLGIGGQMFCFAALSWIEEMQVMLLLVGALGVFNTISWTTAVTAVQLEAPAAVRGRLAMARNALTAAITATLVPLVTAMSHSSSKATPMLLASGTCGVFLLISGMCVRHRDGKHRSALAASKTV
jgi:MFS family permease